MLLDLLGHGRSDKPRHASPHRMDLIHSFGDAWHLARQLPEARLIRTRSFAELWVRSARLTAEITEFLDRVWADGGPAEPVAGLASA